MSPGDDLNWEMMPALELHSVREQWDGLAAANQNVPFLHYDFIAPALHEFGKGREKLLLGRRHGAAVAAAIVFPARLGAWQTFQPSQLPLGAFVGGPDLSIASICEGMLRKLPLQVLQLGMTQIDPHLFERPPDDATIESIDYIETAWLDIEGDHDVYWGARGKNLRQNMAKQRRKLQTEGIEPRLDVLTTPEEVRSGLRDYAELESAGWKAVGGTAVRMDGSQGRFYAAMLEAFSRRGAARVYRYSFNDRPVAVDLCIEAGLLQVVLKTTYDESIKSVSPASLMRQDVLMCEWPLGRINRIEFYGRRMEWHQRWTENVRTLYHLNVHHWAWLKRLRTSRERMVDQSTAETNPPKALSE